MRYLTIHGQIYAETRNHRYPNPSTPQEIFVLRDGFSGFQTRYRVSRNVMFCHLSSWSAALKLMWDASVG